MRYVKENPMHENISWIQLFVIHSEPYYIIEIEIVLLYGRGKNE